jgi:Tle cognate immunity protein 4 C-terminal domain
MQLSLPSDVDVAAVSLPVWLESRRRPSADGRVGSSFSDGQSAGWSQTEFLGKFLVTQALAANESQTVRDEIDRGRLAVKRISDGQRGHSTATSKSFNPLAVSPQNGYAWEFAGSKSAQLFVGDHHLAWESYSGLSEADSTKHFQIMVNGVSPRATFTLPTSPGVCFPHIFVQDDGQQRRTVATTYRLRDHPDVTVLLKDSDATVAQPGNARREVFTAEYRSNDFWSQYKGIEQRIVPVWSPAYRNSNLAGQKALSSFVEITRQDGSADFGYLVIATGDAKAPEDSADLMLYVIREAKIAKAKGLDPISKEALLEMAQIIAASVKRRPVK